MARIPEGFDFRHTDNGEETVQTCRLSLHGFAFAEGEEGLFSFPVEDGMTECRREGY